MSNEAPVSEVPAGEQPAAPEVIEKAKFDEALADLQKFKQRARELEKQQEDAKMQRLKDSQEWHKIAELKEQEADQAKQEADGLRSAYLTDRKFQAVREAAMKAGIRG